MFFLQALITRLKIIFNKYNVVLICFFVLTFGMILSSFNEEEKGIRVGFVTNSEVSDNIVESYNFYNKEIVTAVVYDDEDKMINDVVKGIIDTGYVVKDEDEKFIEYSSQKSTLSEFNKLFLNTIYMQGLAGEFGNSVLKNILNDSEDHIIEGINALNKEYLKDAPFASYEFVENKAYTSNSEESNSVTTTIYLQLIGLLVFLSNIIFLSMDKESYNVNFLNRLGNGKRKVAYLSAGFFAYLVYTMIFMGVLAIWADGTSFFYILFSSLIINLFSLFINLFLKEKNYIVLFIVIYCLLSILFGEIFLNVEAILKEISMAKYFFVTYYLKEIISYNFLGYMAICSFLTVCISFVLLRKYKNY